MDAAELSESLALLGITQADLAGLIDVTPRAVSLWAAGDREVAGPVASYLRLLMSLPRVLQVKELARLKSGGQMQHEGMYGVNYKGVAGAGLAVLVLERGRIFGSDGGAHYDGTYEPSLTRPDHTDLKLHLLVPPGVALVQGVPPQPMTYGFDINCSIAARGMTQLNVETPFGQVEATVSFLRGIPD